MSPVSEKFADKNWRVHPDWAYCEYNYAGNPNREFATPEDNVRHFVGRSQARGWNWATPNVIPMPKCTNKEQFDTNCFKCKLTLRGFLISLTTRGELCPLWVRLSLRG
jgi:hypothetical protein